MKILVADPAKNITVFVLDPVNDFSERTALARAILADSRLGAEQVGFVIHPEAHISNSALWRLEMMGGEFCGNAARCFGLYVARMHGLKGKAEIFVSVSGVNEPLQVELDVERGWAKAEMPAPLVLENLDYEGRPLTLLAFEGITHIIAPDLESRSETFYAIKSLVERKFSLPDALGVMFYDTASRFMVPIVYVLSTDTLIFESSCGSGSAALGAWLSRELQDGISLYAIAQPGGVIETEVTKKAGELAGITIGGEVKLGDPVQFSWQGIL